MRFFSPSLPLSIITLALLSSSLPAQKLHHFPVVGAVTERSAVIAVWLEGEATFSIEYGTSSDLTGAQKSGPVTPTAATDYTANVELAGLEANTRYYYRIVSGAGAPSSRIFSFKTFPPAGIDAPVTLLFGSCQQSRPDDVGKIFSDVAPGLGGDFFIHLGDWSYPDYRVTGYPEAPGSIREAYELRLDTSYAFATKILASMGLAYIWDDHDYAENNGDGSIPAGVKTDLLEGYKRYLPHYPLANPSNGIWHSFRIGNVEVFLIDDRSQRSPIESAFTDAGFNPPPGHSMLAGYPISGVDQRRWLLDAIRSSNARWKILASQVFFNPAIANAIPLALIAGRRDVAVELADKWIGYPADIDSLKGLFAAGHDRNFLIISGDAHTNLYDNGEHSIVPEFMVGNLDKNNSSLFNLLQSYGFNVWTAGQSDSLRTIGRIRIETTPRHRLIVESFNENGVKMLSYEMTDSASSSAPMRYEGMWRIRSAAVVDAGSVVRIEMEHAPYGEGMLEIFDLDGKRVAETPVSIDGKRALRIALRDGLASGGYVGRIRSGGGEIGFKVVVIR